jgi:hypothetical protein
MRIDHPYANLTGGSWLRGNLHAHTTRSDGARPQQAVIDDYAARGYDFLMLSDHDVYTSPQDYAALDAKGLVLIPGNEISRDGVHLLHVNADRLVEPHPDRQKLIDDIRAGGGFAIVNHPNWHQNWDHCPQELLERWTGYAGIEIFNGVIGRLEGSQYATDRWDRLLSRGRRVWGYANDDSHIAPQDVELGWNMVYVRQRSVGAIVESLANGRSYCSTGVVITRIDVEGSRILIETENADRIVASGFAQRRIAVMDAPRIELAAPKDTPYVRFECWGRGERFAWTQPFYVEA